MGLRKMVFKYSTKILPLQFRDLYNLEHANPQSHVPKNIFFILSQMDAFYNFATIFAKINS